ncbi:MAG TPA: hypothetical protein VF715_06320 [Thermoleophilaceae bacterium]|jgi:hypothetical protein
MGEPDDLRQFMRELLTRFDRSLSVIDRRLDDQAAEMREQAAVMRAQATAMRNMADEIRANTQGLLRVLDELRGPA